MNQKGFAPIIIVFLLVVVGSVAAIAILPNIKAPLEKPEQTVGKKVPASEAVLIVKTFCDNFFKGPPAINEPGVMAAIGLLSQKARQSMSTVGPSPSAALAGFTGVSDIPDQGYTIDEVSESAEKATIKTTWKYSGGPVTKTFELGKENGAWKIDSIQ
jgi:hypothetical protein